MGYGMFFVSGVTMNQYDMSAEDVKAAWRQVWLIFAIPIIFVVTSLLLYVGR